jgi:pyrimidine-nucleoside phosphorylase
MYDLIEKKKQNKALSKEEIQWFIEHYINEDIPDYQVSAFMMAIFFNGMTDEETSHLTLSMAESGEMLSLEGIEGIIVDKHSTGGVGDKTTLVVAPMVASLGVPVAKMSGRGLGHTGGTIDKLESIPGFKTSIPIEQFIENVNSIKIAIAGQTANLAPADKKLYALRDVTATVNQRSLIASSIMSKKIASGANAIVLDVKVGTGAFMKNEPEAIELAEIMVSIGKKLGRDTTAIISDMNQPLGFAVGNNLEVIEAINTLNGNGPKDLLEVSLELASHMVYHAKKASSIEEAKKMLQETIDNGSALRKFMEFVKAQGGDESFVSDTSKFQGAMFKEVVNAESSGYIASIEAEQIGYSALVLGGGRETKESVIDLSVGIIIEKKIGDYVTEGEPLAIIHGNNSNKIANAKTLIQNAYVISETEIEPPQIIKKVIT